MCFKNKVKNLNCNDTFVSYSHQDREFVEYLCSILREKGVSIWVDWENIAIRTNWWQEVQKAIKNAKTFIFIISPNSIRSKYCCAEIAYAIKYRKQIIPIVFSKVSNDLWEEVFDRDEKICAKTKTITYNHGKNIFLKDVNQSLIGYEWILLDTSNNLNTDIQKLIELISSAPD